MSEAAEEYAKRRVLWMNLLFAAGLALALPWFAAGVIAHRWGPARGTLWASHHTYGVRTFWFGLLGMLAPLLAPQVGLPLLALVWLWCAARLVRAFLAWDREEWITDPGRFL
ncbi:MAG: hypothetical protein IRY87_29605 [Acetobacteraceae bacterium]|mgnify:CR=1 FL=1|nr:hypothetical protein [Acetobacteraceae bacterium]